jgi:hypothetical protein
MPSQPYSRVYWSVMDDEKFDGIREDVRHFGSWTILLIVADMAYPAPAFIPATVPKASVKALSACGLVDLLSGGRFRVHGLASEREMRSDSGRNAAAKRWHSNGNADPMLDETRRDKQSKATRMNANGRRSTVDRDPHLREYRDAIREIHGPGMDEPPPGWKVKS